jgi:SAM-dependent methyltransferase
MDEILKEHFGYLADRVKLRQYQAAIARILRPNHTVLDLGCGTGLLGLMALRAGARKVYFVEEGPVIEVARRTVIEAGFADQAEFFRKNSFELVLPGRVDVVVCDHVGYFGFDYGILQLLADARERFLTPNGILVPAGIRLKLAPVGSNACQNIVGQWRDGSVPDEYAWLGSSAANIKHAVRLEQDDLMAEPATLAVLSLGTEVAPYLSWNAEFSCARAGSLDGVAGWFECELADGLFITNSPTATERLNRPLAFLPLETPVDVSAGERIKVTVMARPTDQVIGWCVDLPDRGQRFGHTTFNGLLLDNESLTRVRPERVAKLNDRGRMRQVVLSYCDGVRTIGEVEALVRNAHPDLFPSAQAMSAFIMQVLAKDTSD